MAVRKKTQKTPMTDAHKQALAAGREQGRAVRLYLEALEQHRPKRGRKRTPESIKKRLAVVEKELHEADPLSRVHLLQERRNLADELAAKEAGSDLSELEEGFVSTAASYGKRKGITYETWREVGVGAGLLKRAGIGRGSP
jgi:hypothetical protein